MFLYSCVYFSHSIMYLLAQAVFSNSISTECSCVNTYFHTQSETIRIFTIYTRAFYRLSNRTFKSKSEALLCFKCIFHSVFSSYR